MNRKAEIIIEKFSQGITSRCVRSFDVPGLDRPSKSLAIHGTECGIIGKEIWRDVLDTLNEYSSDKVRIKLEYEAIA